MDADALKLLAHIDQTHSNMREILHKMSDPEITALVQICSRARFDDLDEKGRLLVGLLAITSICDLQLNPPEET